MRVHMMRRAGNVRPVQQKVRPQSRAPLTYTERAEPFKPVRGVETLLELQRQYGNRYVQRVLNLTGKVEGEAEASSDVIQRWRFGAGAVAGEPNFRPVVLARRPRVRAAMRLLGRIVSNRRCQNYFRDNCPGGRANTLRDLYRRMRVWELRERGSLGGNSGDNVAYEDPYIYRIGRWAIVATILHELMHMCGLGTTEANELACERAVERCRTYTPFIESVSPRSGPVGTVVTITGFGFGLAQGSTDRVEFNGVDAGRAIRWQYTHDVGSEIRIRVPAGARTGSLVVINNRVRSNVFRFTVTP